MLHAPVTETRRGSPAVSVCMRISLRARASAVIGVRFPALEPHDGFALESNFDFATLYYMRVVCVCVCVYLRGIVDPWHLHPWWARIIWRFSEMLHFNGGVCVCVRAWRGRYGYTDGEEGSDYNIVFLSYRLYICDTRWHASVRS